MSVINNTNDVAITAKESQSHPILMETPKYDTISSKAATRNGYQVVCGPYATRVPQQWKWLRNVLADMQGANIVLVQAVGGIEVWRHSSEMKG